jgi:hypothetical protein
LRFLAEIVRKLEAFEKLYALRARYINQNIRIEDLTLSPSGAAIRVLNPNITTTL